MSRGKDIIWKRMLPFAIWKSGWQSCQSYPAMSCTEHALLSSYQMITLTGRQSQSCLSRATSRQPQCRRMSACRGTASRLPVSQSASMSWRSTSRALYVVWARFPTGMTASPFNTRWRSSSVSNCRSALQRKEVTVCLEF